MRPPGWTFFSSPAFPETSICVIYRGICSSWSSPKTEQETIILDSGIEVLRTSVLPSRNYLSKYLTLLYLLIYLFLQLIFETSIKRTLVWNKYEFEIDKLTYSKLYYRRTYYFTKIERSVYPWRFLKYLFYQPAAPLDSRVGVSLVRNIHFANCDTSTPVYWNLIITFF